MNKEIRAYNFEIRADHNDQHGNFIYGVPIVFNKPTDIGDYEEVIATGALDKADLRDVRFLVNHNTDMIPLARSRNNNENSTMQMSVGEDAMGIRVDLDTENNAEAKSLYSAVNRGDITGMSFMFAVDRDKWDGLDTKKPKRTIISIRKVFEVSAVTWPAYEQTSLEARSNDAALDSAASVLDSAKRKAEEDLKANENEEARQAILAMLEE